MVFDIFVITILFLIFKKEIINNFIDLKKNHKEYFEKYLKYWFLALGLMIISNGIITMFTDSIAANQDAINELFTRNPIYIVFSAVLIAPIAEELVLD
jgi:membrane protease YdiL (CAAX protease family)